MSTTEALVTDSHALTVTDSHNPVVAAPIVGPTKPQHITDAVAALDVHLTDDEIQTLEGAYTPRVPAGY